MVQRSLLSAQNLNRAPCSAAQNHTDTQSEAIHAARSYHKSRVLNVEHQSVRNLPQDNIKTIQVNGGFRFLSADFLNLIQSFFIFAGGDRNLQLLSSDWNIILSKTSEEVNLLLTLSVWCFSLSSTQKNERTKHKILNSIMAPFILHLDMWVRLEVMWLLHWLKNFIPPPATILYMTKMTALVCSGSARQPGRCHRTHMSDPLTNIISAAIGQAKMKISTTQKHFLQRSRLWQEVIVLCKWRQLALKHCTVCDKFAKGQPPVLAAVGSPTSY